MIQAANRINSVKEYYFSTKLREIADMNAKGMDILNLGIGNPDMPPSDATIQTLNVEANKANNHGYQSYTGIPELKAAFSEWYKTYFGVSLDAGREILPLIGSKEGILHVSMAFLNPGDEVLVPDPGYPTYSSVSELVGAKIRNYDLIDSFGWMPNLDALEKTDLSRVKLMWVNYPNMPTGTPATMEIFQALVAFGKKHEIVIVNDNPYSFILNDEPLSILSVEGAKDICIELNSLSKSHNMAGWRIGMVATNATFIQYILRVKSNVDSGMFKPLQLAAVKALSQDKSWYREVNSRYAERRSLVFEIMDLLNCTYDEKQTGMFIWAKIPATFSGSEELAENILHQARVFITPGFIFGKNGNRYIRISLCSSLKMLREAINRIEKVTTKK